MALNQARPAPGFRNVKNSYRAASAGERWIRKCWVSSNSSDAVSAFRNSRPTLVGSGGLEIAIGIVAPERNSPLLHQVKHFGKLRFELQCLLNFVRCRVWILTVLQKARTLVFANELDERWYVRLPVLGKTLKVLENCVHPDLFKQGYCILSVLVEICIEDSLVHELRVIST